MPVGGAPPPPPPPGGAAAAAAISAPDGASGLDTVLAKLKDGDLQKLEVSPNQPRASALEDWLQRVALRVGGWHRLMG
eukprot:4677844-Pyramimonas_sp.AAC.1